MRGIQPPFPIEKPVNWLCYRTAGDGSGDYLLLDTQYNKDCARRCITFSLLSAHLNGFPLLRGNFNSLEIMPTPVRPQHRIFQRSHRYGKAAITRG